MATTPERTHRGRNVSLAAVSLFAALTGFAQTVAPRVDAGTLTKYDKNKNGVLDADEVATMQADQAKAAAAVETKSGTGEEQVVQLSPFEVSAMEDRGYAASNTLAGTRLNSPGSSWTLCSARAASRRSV